MYLKSVSVEQSPAFGHKLKFCYFIFPCNDYGMTVLHVTMLYEFSEALQL